MIEEAALLVNGLVTIGGGLPLGYLYWKKEVRLLPFALWSVGFIIYGIQILSRFAFSLPLSNIVIVIVNIVAFAFFVLGTSILVEETAKLLAIFGPFVGLAVILAFSGFGTIGLALATVGLYGSVAFGSFIIARRLGKTANRFAMGWTLLFVANFLIPLQIPLYIVNILAAASKVIIILGMMDQKFTTSLLRLSKYHQSLAKPLISQKGELLFILAGKSRQKEIDWLNKHIRERTTEKRLTHLIAAYDAPITSALEHLASIYGMVLVKVVPKPRNVGIRKENPLTIEIGDDPGDFLDFVSSLLRECARAGIPSEIIIIGLSWLTNKWGEDEILTYLVAQSSVVRASDVFLTCLIYPELHSDWFIEACQRFGHRTIEF